MTFRFTAFLTSLAAASLLFACGYSELPDGDTALPPEVVVSLDRGDDIDLFSSWNVETGWDVDSRADDVTASGIHYFNKWDTENDEFLSEKEITNGMFDYYGGGDGVITLQEFMAKHQHPSEEAVFKTWDDDEDGVLSKDEFAEGARIPLIIAIWDNNQDSLVSQAEIQTRFFRASDVNNDGTISSTEWSL